MVYQILHRCLARTNRMSVISSETFGFYSTPSFFYFLWYYETFNQRACTCVHVHICMSHPVVPIFFFRLHNPIFCPILYAREIPELHLNIGICLLGCCCMFIYLFKLGKSCLVLIKWLMDTHTHGRSQTTGGEWLAGGVGMGRSNCVRVCVFLCVKNQWAYVGLKHRGLNYSRAITRGCWPPLHTLAHTQTPCTVT